MEEDFYTRMRKKAEERQGGSPARSALTTVIASFLLGGAAVGIAAWQFGWWSSDEAIEAAPTSALADVPPDAPSPESAEAARTANAAANEAAVAVQAVEKVAEQQGGIDSRVAAMEQRLTRLDIQAQAAYSNAARAEALLVAFATRRAIERGTPLDYLEQQIKVRFGDGYPQAVQAVLDEAERPVTTDKLRASLDALAPQLLDDPQDESGWEWFKREVSALFIIRKTSTPSPAPARRLERARLFLESGQVENAIAEVRQMPGAENAGPWIADADRYAKALRALDLLETSAIVGTEQVRDASGAPVEPQPRSGAQ